MDPQMYCEPRRCAGGPVPGKTKWTLPSVASIRDASLASLLHHGRVQNVHWEELV